MTTDDSPPGSSARRQQDTESDEPEPLGTMEDVSHTPDEGTSADRVWDGTRVRPADDDE